MAIDHLKKEVEPTCETYRPILNVPQAMDKAKTVVMQ
jgi:hypothetical protein